MKCTAIIFFVVIILFSSSGCATILHPSRMQPQNEGIAYTYDWGASILNILITPASLSSSGGITMIYPIWHLIDFLTGAAYIPNEY